jgi:hypothetical protein
MFLEPRVKTLTPKDKFQLFIFNEEGVVTTLHTFFHTEVIAPKAHLYSQTM